MWIIWPFRKKNFGSAWTICADFRRFVEPDIGKFIIQDEKSLPHSKAEIFEAMCVLAMTETDGSILDAVNASAFELAFFQPEVGARRLHPLGIDRDLAGSDDAAARSRAQTADPSGKEKYDRFKPLRDADWERMKATLARVQRKAAG